MATVLADTYYLKALECYPWEPSEVLENLTYALSYDSDHAPSNCLMGVLQMEKLKDYSAAEYYLQQAIAADSEYACAYENLVRLYLVLMKLDKAERVALHAQKIAGVSRSFILGSMSRILELRGSLKLAKKNMQAALAECINSDERSFIEEEISRLKAKVKSQRRQK